MISAIGGASAVLVARPANAKTELIKHIGRQDPQFIERIAAFETLDHPSDGEFVARASVFPSRRPNDCPETLRVDRLCSCSKRTLAAWGRDQL